MIDFETFRSLTLCTKAAADAWYLPMVGAMNAWAITTRARQAGFLATCTHESQHFQRFEENLNYSVQGLASTWPTRFAQDRLKPPTPNALAWEIGRSTGKKADVQRLAEIVYGGRMGNTQPGWGYLYRGRGPIQCTGWYNYNRLGILTGINLVDNPDKLLEPETGSIVSAAAWYDAGCNQYMDVGDFRSASKTINGGLIGYEDGNEDGMDDRVELWVHAKAGLGVDANLA